MGVQMYETDRWVENLRKVREHIFSVFSKSWNLWHNAAAALDKNYSEFLMLWWEHDLIQGL